MTDLIKKVATGIARNDEHIYDGRDDHYYIDLARAALAAIEDAGWAVVPVEPDETMATLGAATFQVAREPDSVGRHLSGCSSARAVYTAMLYARPRLGDAP